MSKVIGGLAVGAGVAAGVGVAAVLRSPSARTRVAALAGRASSRVAEPDSVVIPEYDPTARSAVAVAIEEGIDAARAAVAGDLTGDAPEPGASPSPEA